MKSFWKAIKKPIIGLAPMDGITDPAFRAIVDEVGHPSVLYTEFVSAEGLSRNSKRLLRTFVSHKTSTPLIGQLFGADPIAMQEAAGILLEKTTVIGIDINMGCPQRDVVHNGAGAALITNPTLARKLIEAVYHAIGLSKRAIGLSVKTRIGFTSVDVEHWTSSLLDTPLDALSMHGRTYQEVFKGPVHWKELKKAAALAAKHGKIFLGNGDILSLHDAREKISLYTPDGVLIGRGAFGNPWVFQERMPNLKTRIHAAIRHIQLFEELTPTANPLSLRKHLAWYIKGFPQATSIRDHIMKITTTKEALDFLSSLSYSE